MTAIDPGIKAPQFRLPTTTGDEYDLAAVLRSSPAVIISFFKVSCPVCQFSFPFLERLQQNYPSLPVWGISQDDPADTNEFASSFGLTFPMLLDKDLKSTVDYDLTNVPSTFLVRADGLVEQAIIGFSKSDFEELSRKAAVIARLPIKQIFTEDDDDIPALKPG